MVQQAEKDPKPFTWTKTADEIPETLAFTANELTIQDTRGCPGSDLRGLPGMCCYPW